MRNIKMINVGLRPNDGTGDTLRNAAKKINHNFSLLFKKLRIGKPFKIIVWENLSDTEKAMKDVNYNFKIIEKHLLGT